MWSGGKDSALALYRAQSRGLTIVSLLNFFDRDSGRVRFHATRTELVRAQAAAAGIPLRQYATTWTDFDGIFRDALADLAGEGIAGIVFGDIHLADVRAWYEERVRAAGLAHVEPLWGDVPRDLISEFVDVGGRAVVTCCETAKLDDAWLGRIIDAAFVSDVLRLPIDPCGENGEYHSFAFAGPMFHREISWARGERRDDGRFAQLDLTLP
jgi:uncharacterized protein (TIGR00290 family)